MAVAYSFVFLILFFIAISSLKKRLPFEEFNEDDVAEIKKSLRGSIIVGSFGLIFLVFYFVSLQYILDFSIAFIVLSLVISIVCFFTMLIFWGMAPTKESVRRRKNIAVMDASLQNYKFDKLIHFINSDFCLALASDEIIIKNTFEGFYYTIPFSSIVDCEIVENGSTIMKGGIGRAIVGGVVAGGVGAIVGASTRNSKEIVNSLFVRIITSDITDAMKTLEILKVSTSKGSPSYLNAQKAANEIYSCIVSIIDRNSKAVEPLSTNNIEHSEYMVGTTNCDVFEAIEKLAGLNNRGILSDDEYLSKKIELLKRL